MAAGRSPRVAIVLAALAGWGAVVIVPGPASARVTCGGVPVAPTSELQAVIDANPPGTVFCFEPGTYVVTTPMVPRERDAFVAAPGTILSGLDRSSAAFAGFPARASGVTVRGFVIEHFTGVDAQAAVITWSGWRVQSNQVRFNGFAGIRVTGTGSVVRWNSSHHNGRYGIIGAGSNILIEGNDISFNNVTRFPVWDAGGTKFTNSSGLTFNKNYVHDNVGPGLWADSNNYGVLYTGNRVSRNQESGIQHEISYDAVIRDNIVEGNALNSVGRSLWW